MGLDGNLFLPTLASIPSSQSAVMPEAQAIATPAAPLTSVPHPATLPPGEGRLAAIDYWLRSGRDPHQPAPHAHEGEDDESTWALVLPTTADLLGVALDLGAEANRPVFVSGPQGGGWVPPSLMVLAGPLEEAAAKIRKLKAQDMGLEWEWHARWPGRDRFGDAAIHLIVSAQFSDASVKPKLAEAAIRDLIDETIANQAGLILMRDSQGRTALHRALELQRLEVAAVLLQGATQAQAQALDHRGRSPLHVLAENPGAPRDYLPLVRQLVSHGTLWDAPDNEGVTAAQRLDASVGEVERDAWRNLVQRTSTR